MQVWDDQPPLFAQLLRCWFDVLGWDVNTGRMLVLLFAALTVFALYDIVRMVAGHGAAVLACALLAASAYFARLSVSLMIGLPAIALATLALWALFRWLQDGARRWIVAAGVLMGCSLGCKLMTVVLLPVFALWLAGAGRRNAMGQVRWRPSLAWLMYTLLTAALLLLILVGPTQLPALVSMHLIARRAPVLARFGPLGLAVTGFAEWPLTLLALGAYVLLALQRQVITAVFPLWVAVGFLSLLSHAPVWYHHQMLLTLPHCAASGIVVAELWRRNQRTPLASGATMVFLRFTAVALVAAQFVWTVLGTNRPVPIPLAGAAERVLADMAELTSVTQVVLATNPMYAFRAGYEVPPPLAVLSLKRVATDVALPDEIRMTFADHAPEQVVLTQEADPRVAAWVRQPMSDRYQLRHNEQGTALFARRDLVASGKRDDDP